MDTNKVSATYAAGQPERSSTARLPGHQASRPPLPIEQTQTRVSLEGRFQDPEAFCRQREEAFASKPLAYSVNPVELRRVQAENGLDSSEPEHLEAHSSYNLTLEQLIRISCFVNDLGTCNNAMIYLP